MSPWSSQLIRTLLGGLLDVPWVYRAVQRLAVPDGGRVFQEQLAPVIAELPPGWPMLDVGCGPRSLLWGAGLQPIGLDITFSYMESYRASGGQATLGSATSLPFRDACFEGVWSVGLFHHLDDDQARQAASEMLRVAKHGSYVVVFDGVYPEPGWRRPLIWLQRRFDRGTFMRCEAALISLLPDRARWTTNRVCYSTAGHEGVFCIYRVS
jgi:SAM-dependent methyltransferase